MIKVLINNQMVDFDAAVALMDDDVRESVHDQFRGLTEQDFADAYCAAHHIKYGSDFEVN